MNISKPEYFKTSFGMMLEPQSDSADGGTEQDVPIPRLFPPGETAEFYESLASSGIQSTLFIVIIQVIVQIIIKGSFDFFFGFIMYMQIVKCIALYDLNIPANVMVIIEQLRKIVEFEALKPKNLALIFWTEEELKGLKESLGGTMSMNFVNSGVESSDFTENFG